MRSKTSFFNGTLYRKNLSRFWPLWGAASFVGGMVPLTLLLQLTRMGDLGPLDPLMVKQGYYMVLTVVLPVVSLLYAVLCAAAVWGYLDNPKSVGLMHRLPIRREGLFLTNLLSGMSMMLIPYAVTGALTVLLTALQRAVAFPAMLTAVLGVLGESFFYFSSATFVAFLTGNAFAMPVLYFLLHFLQPLVMALVGALQSGFYYGVPGSNPHTAEWLCPTVYLMNHVQYQDIFAETQRWNGHSYYTGQKLMDVELHGFYLIGVYALAGLGLLTLALLLYKRRSSEHAGDVAAVPGMRPVFRYAGAFLSGIAGGLLLYTLVWRPFQERYDAFELLPLLLCVIFMGLVGCYGISMLLSKSFRVFSKKSLPGAAALSLALAALLLGIRMDLFHVESRVPARETIESVELYVDGNQYVLEAGKNDGLIDQLLEVHGSIVGDLDHLQEADRADAQMNSSYAHLSLIYHLRGGDTLDRNYSLTLWKERAEDPETYDAKLFALLNSPEAKRLRLMMDEEVQVTGGSLNSPNYDFQMELLPSEAEAIREAVARDAQAGCWGNAQWFGEELGEEFASVDIYMQEKQEESSHRSRNLYLILRPEMEETIALLREMGYLGKEELNLIRREDARETGRPGAAPAQDGQIFVNGEATQELTLEGLSESESMGVIGGADGPTAVFITN